MTYRGVVYPAQCDAMGHMNTPFYVAAFDQAMWHLVAEFGFRAAWIQERRQGWADVKYVIEFRSELGVGDLFQVESAVERVGKTSLVTRHALLETGTSKVAAEVEMTSVYFNLEKRVSLPIPELIRAAAEAMLAEAAT